LQELIQYFAVEHFLYRLSRSSFTDRFIWLGDRSIFDAKSVPNRVIEIAVMAGARGSALAGRESEWLAKIE